MRALLSAVCCVGAGLLLSGSARAEVLIATSEEAHIDHAEVALAWNGTDVVSWLALRAAGGDFALVVPHAAETELQRGLDAWLSALEETASVRVVPGSSSAPCSEGPLRMTWPRGKGRAPDAELELSSPEDVRDVLAQHGLETAQSPRAAPLYGVLLWRGSEAVTTTTLRIQGEHVLEALLARADFPVSVTALTRGAMRMPEETDKRTLEVTYFAGPKPSSDYRELVARSAAPLLEMRGSHSLFDWVIFDDLTTVAPLVTRFVDRAKEEIDFDAAACARMLGELRDGAPLEPEACGAARDAALAFAVAPGQSATLARWVGSRRVMLSDAQQWLPGGAPESPLLEAAMLDLSGCEPDDREMVIELPQHDDRHPYPPPAELPEPQPAREEVVPVYAQTVEPGCSSTPAPECECAPEAEESCSSTSSGASDGDETCASDSSGASDDTESCSSDSSGASDDDETCASDSSSQDDEDCSGGSETEESETTGYDGETCTGQATAKPAAQGSAAQPEARAPRRGRLRLSAWSVGFAALVLPIRRGKRRRVRHS